MYKIVKFEETPTATFLDLTVFLLDTDEDRSPRYAPGENSGRIFSRGYLGGPQSETILILGVFFSLGFMDSFRVWNSEGYPQGSRAFQHPVAPLGRVPFRKQ
jgi:hypothetical protein